MHEVDWAFVEGKGRTRSVLGDKWQNSHAALLSFPNYLASAANSDHRPPANGLLRRFNDDNANQARSVPRQVGIRCCAGATTTGIMSSVRTGSRYPPHLLLAVIAGPFPPSMCSLGRVRFAVNCKSRQLSRSCGRARNSAFGGDIGREHEQGRREFGPG